MQISAETFLVGWKAKYVAETSNKHLDSVAKILALRCWRDAARVGISTSGLFAAAGGDLVANIRGTLDRGSPLQS
jgi:hypothetical protein